MMTTEELALEVHRLRMLNGQRRRMAEQAESDVRRLRSRTQVIERGMTDLTDRLRTAVESGCSRMELNEFIAAYERFQNQLKQL